MKQKDLDDLPPELLAELEDNPNPRGIGVMIMDILHNNPDGIDLNGILISLYRNHGVIQKRKTLSTWLGRNAAQGTVKRFGRGLYKKARRLAQNQASPTLYAVRAGQ